MECSVNVRNRNCKMKPTKQIISNNNYLCTRHSKNVDCIPITGIVNVIIEPVIIEPVIIPFNDLISRIPIIFPNDDAFFDIDNDNVEYAASQQKQKDEADITAQTFSHIYDAHDIPSTSSTTNCIICLNKIHSVYNKCGNCNIVIHEDCLNLWKTFKNYCPICNH